MTFLEPVVSEIAPGLICPECESTVVREEGCLRCTDLTCGWSRCQLGIPILLTLERARELVPGTDCSDRVYSSEEKEDIARFMVQGAEYQRDRMVEYIKHGYATVHPEVSEDKQ